MAVTCVEEAVQAALAADVSLIALIPATRIKSGTASQKEVMPYIVHFPVAGTPTQLLADLAPFKIWDFYQVSVFAASYASGSSAARAVAAAIGRKTTSDGVEFMLSGE